MDGHVPRKHENFEHVILHMLSNYSEVYSWELLNWKLIEVSLTIMITIVGIQEIKMQIDQAFDKAFLYWKWGVDCDRVLSDTVLVV
jgi:hypothetical protein